jgi:hypothetical protein
LLIMNVPPPGITDEAWQEAIRAGFHATPEASRREIEEILIAAVPALGLVPAQAGPANGAASPSSGRGRTLSSASH